MIVKGTGVIYPPKGQAGEYAPLATNPYRGCGHGCAYCYVPLVTKQPRPEFDAGAIPRKDFEARLLADARRYQAAGVTEQVMLSFTTDPYHPGDTKLTRRTLEILREHGMAFCTLTKGGLRALRDLDLFRPDRDAFACTLTTLDDVFSRKWERNAALPGDRIAALRTFAEHEIFTWVSLEPTLDVDASLALIDATYQFVDLYKVGRANYLKDITRTTDWRDYTLRVVDRMQRYGAKHYIKQDLQPYLPAGYFNPLRIPQHRSRAASERGGVMTSLKVCKDEAEGEEVLQAALDAYTTAYSSRRVDQSGHENALAAAIKVATASLTRQLAEARRELEEWKQGNRAHVVAENVANARRLEAERQLAEAREAFRSISQLLSYGMNTPRHDEAKAIADAQSAAMGTTND